MGASSRSVYVRPEIDFLEGEAFRTIVQAKLFELKEALFLEDAVGAGGPFRSR